MALKKLTPSSVPSPIFKIMLTGFYDVGKTYSVYADKSKKMVVIDTEGRFANYANNPGFEHLLQNAIVYSGKEVDTLEKIYQIIKDVRDDDGKNFNMLFIDSMTVLYNKILTGVSKMQKAKARAKGNETMASVGKDGFGAVKLDWQTLLTELYGLPVQFVFTSQDKQAVEGVEPILDKNTLALPDLALRLTRDKSSSKAKPIAEVIKAGSSSLNVGQRITDFSMEKLWGILKVNQPQEAKVQASVAVQPVKEVKLEVNPNVNVDLALIKATLDVFTTKKQCTDYLEDLRTNKAYPEDMLKRGGEIAKLVGDKYATLES